MIPVHFCALYLSVFASTTAASPAPPTHSIPQQTHNLSPGTLFRTDSLETQHSPSTNSAAKPAKCILYCSIGDLPAWCAVRLLPSLANGPATRCGLIKSLSLGFIRNRVLFALELLIPKVPRWLPWLRSLSIEVSFHKNRHCALAWIFPRDAPFRLRLFATSIR